MDREDDRLDTLAAVVALILLLLIAAAAAFVNYVKFMAYWKVAFG